MADTTDTRPGSAPGVAKTGADGSLPDLGGRTAWVWMQDTEEGGGGRFDVRANRVDMWRRKGATVVPNYPLNFNRSGRTAKPHAHPAGAATGDAEPTGTPEPAPDPTLAMPASALGAVGPADEQQPDITPAAAGGEQTDQAAGDTAAADTTQTTTRKGGRTR